ncbi:MAG: T9SS type A sorting domain-containing protein [Candidatus Eisenbacteria bacterium]|nr:T9SS type A sorting domain-containing protein [Candidatus Eisenbacteria bacterium]
MVEATYGSDRILWFDEHWCDALAIPEAQHRAAWYDIYLWPYVRIDGSRYYQGIDGCEGTAALLGEKIDLRIAETGGMSPVMIQGIYQIGDASVRVHSTLRLLDPAVFDDPRAYFFVLEDSVWSEGFLLDRVTREIVERPVAFSGPGDDVVFDFYVTMEPSWHSDHLKVIAFLQEHEGDLEIVQGARLQELPPAMGVGEPVTAFASAILGAQPNPFRVSTEIVFAVSPAASRDPIRLELFDVQGRRIATFVDGSRAPGEHTVRFDAARGAEAGGPGILFARLTTSEGTVQRKLIRLE